MLHDLSGKVIPLTYVLLWTIWYHISCYIWQTNDTLSCYNTSESTNVQIQWSCHDFMYSWIQAGWRTYKTMSTVWTLYESAFLHRLSLVINLKNLTREMSVFLHWNCKTYKSYQCISMHFFSSEIAAIWNYLKKVVPLISILY